MREKQRSVRELLEAAWEAGYQHRDAHGDDIMRYQASDNWIKENCPRQSEVIALAADLRATGDEIREKASAYVACPDNLSLAELVLLMRHNGARIQFLMERAAEHLAATLDRVEPENATSPHRSANGSATRGEGI